MKLLIITPYCIVPSNTGGQIRVYELAQGVSQLGISTTVAMPITFTQVSRIQVNNRLTLRVTPYPFILPLLFTDKPFSYNFLMSFHPGYTALLKRFIKTNDIIQFEGASFGDLAGAIPNDKIVIYDAHNVESDYETGEGRGKWTRSKSVKRIQLLEKKLTCRADRILTCSKKNSERMSELYKISADKCVVVPNGIHVNQGSPRLTEKQVMGKFPAFLNFQHRAIFSGSDVAHNRAAVEFIMKSLAPTLRTECAFLFKGQCGNRFKHQKADNLFFDPTPGNVGPYADICTVAVNPVTQGSGTSLKVLDFLAHGLPVVSTEFGMRGFEDLKKHVTLVEQDSFSEALRRRHVFHPQIKMELKKFSWSSIVKSLYETYHSIN